MFIRYELKKTKALATAGTADRATDRTVNDTNDGIYEGTKRRGEMTEMKEAMVESEDEPFNLSTASRVRAPSVSLADVTDSSFLGHQSVL